VSWETTFVKNKHAREMTYNRKQLITITDFTGYDHRIKEYQIHVIQFWHA